LYSANEVPTGVVQVISGLVVPAAVSARNRLPGSVSEPTVTAPDADSVDKRTFNELAARLDDALYETP
jgi:hypothetical protein